MHGVSFRSLADLLGRPSHPVRQHIPEAISLGYTGRSWPLEFTLFGPDGKAVAQDVWIGSNCSPNVLRSLRATAGKTGRSGWSFAVVGYGMARLKQIDLTPARENFTFYFSAAQGKLFEPE